MTTPQDPEAAETAQTTSVPAVDLPLLVRLVANALEATKGLLFWDIIADEDDIRELLVRKLERLGDSREAMESTIESLIGRHEEAMKGAAQDQCYQACKTAIRSLPNDEPTDR